MPTVLQIDGFMVRILTNDHEPAHVHVVRAGGEAKIRLGLKGEAPELLRISKGMTDREAAKAYGIVTRSHLKNRFWATAQNRFCEWNESDQMQQACKTAF